MENLLAKTLNYDPVIILVRALRSKSDSRPVPPAPSIRSTPTFLTALSPSVGYSLAPFAPGSSRHPLSECEGLERPFSFVSPLPLLPTAGVTSPL
jgi:hypothetical protein